MSIGEVGEKLRRSTVQVRSGEHSSGSGIVWDDSGTIVTNAHVIGSAGKNAVTIEFWNGATATASVDKRDVRRDLALLRLQPNSSLEPALNRDSSRVRIGEFVIAVGNPLGFTGALSTGVVHGAGPIVGLSGRDFIQTTARLAPGNSGGPLADSEGRVIGINTMVVSGGLGLAVPSNAVRHLLQNAPPFELGVSLRPVRIHAPSPGIALLVLEIAPGSAAEYASLKVGDILIGCGGKRFHTVDELRDVLDGTVGGSVSVQFLRGGETKRREVVIRFAPALAA